MLRWMLASTLLISTHAVAQQSSTTITPAEVASASTELSLATSAPVVKSPWHLVLGSENYTYENEQRAHGSDAPIISYNFVGARYNINAKWDVELRQQFQYVSNIEHLGGRDRTLHRNTLELAETVLRVIAKPGWSLVGSKNTMFDFRYYAPTDHTSQFNQELGRLRLDAYTEWVYNPQWTVGALLSPRVLLNSPANPNGQVGSDAQYYMIKAAPYVYYNFNDIVQAYYAYTYVGASTQAQRGSWDPDMVNGSAQEIGVNISYGPFLINPAIVSETNLNDSSGSVMSDDSRAFAYDGLSYNLNLYATF
ncbi:hypothetical protein [Bdellovibrio sp. HCB2-146]|uniref:hypothetical protein n=1 Tax=Bdellovibrio sp. HCB2-146 TaxID=3394362 RepID=UPI0039BC8594